MIAVLAVLATAAAGELTCSELLQLEAAHVPSSEIIAVVEARGIPSSELACIDASALSEPVKVAASRNLLATGVPAPPSPSSAGILSRGPDLGTPPANGLELGSGWLREDPCSPYTLMETLPDKGVAMILSGTVGFGSGHFYSNRKQVGMVMLVSQGAWAVATAIGYANLRVAAERGELGDPTLMQVGRIGLGAFRLLDFATAHRSARITREEALQACGWVPSAGR